MARVTQNLTGFVISVTSVSGTVTSGAQADLFAVDSTGKPTGASLATVTWTPSASVSTQSFGTPYAVTAGTCYAIVIKNILGTPASNLFSIQSYTGASVTSGINANTLNLASVDGGTTWVAYASNLSGHSFVGTSAIAPVYASYGTDCSYLCAGTGYTSSVTRLYNAAGTRTARCAIKWNAEIDVLLWGFTFPMKGNTGFPTYDLCGEVCSASASLSTSDSTINCAGVVDSSRVGFRWAVPYRLLANTDYYIGVTPVTVGNGTNSVYASAQTATPLMVSPTIGPIKGYYESTNSGTPSWAQDATKAAFIMPTIEIPSRQMGRGIQTGGRL